MLILIISISYSAFLKFYLNAINEGNLGINKKKSVYDIEGLICVI